MEVAAAAARTHPRATGVAGAAGALVRPPVYLEDTYRWAYLSPRWLRALDRHWVVSTILFGNYRRLQRAFLEEVAAGLRVLQAACVYGDFSAVLARALGPSGRLDVLDVSELQIQNCRRKLAAFPNARTWLLDAAEIRDVDYDLTVSFFLLHEMPDEYKAAVTGALLDTVPRGGKVVFVDYHRPVRAHPLRGVVSVVFDALEPYARSLWRHEIAHFAPGPERFAWTKRTFFGGLYQKVVARRL